MPLAEASASPLPGAKLAKESTLAHKQFHCLPHVLSARAGDTVVLMDGKRGAYYTLNDVGGRVWELAGDGRTTSQICERLLEEYDVPPQQLERDVASTLHQLLGDRLIAPGAAPVPERHLPTRTVRTAVSSREFRIPSVLRCGLVIFAVKARLKTLGFGRTIKWVRLQVEAVPVRAEADLETVKAVEYRVALAGALWPGRAKCLEQSLTLYQILRCHGFATTLRLGVQPFPFVAHAWVEYQGLVINDVPEHVQHFVPFPGLPS